MITGGKPYHELSHLSEVPHLAPVWKIPAFSMGGSSLQKAAGSIIYYDASSLSWLESQSVDWDWPTGWGPQSNQIWLGFIGISWGYFMGYTSNCNWALITVIKKNMGIVHQLLILGMGWAPVDIFHIAMAHHHLNAGGSKQITLNFSEMNIYLAAIFSFTS